MSLNISHEKICTICGQDCSNFPRFKDEQGRYLHESCFNQEQTSQPQVSQTPNSGLSTPPSAPAQRSQAWKPSSPKRSRKTSKDNEGLVNLLFSIEGRVSRLQFWMVCLTLSVLNGIVAVMSVNSESILFTIVSIILFWPGLAMSIKRWHDRDKSGFWVLIGFIPIIGWIWVLVELGFLKGTDGPNSYGSDPT